MLDLKRLHYLDAVYRYRNFTRASEELFVSQPAISAAVSSLEKQLGVKLIMRTPKAVEFTDEGEQFMEHVKIILRQCDEAERQMRDLSDEKQQALRFGVSPTLTHQIVPYLYTGFFPMWNEADIKLYEGSMNHHIEMLKEDELDLSYNALPGETGGGLSDEIAVKKITTGTLLAVMSADHRLAKNEKVSIEMFDGELVALPDEKSLMRRLVVEAFRKHGVVPHTVLEHEQLICMFDLLKVGGYIAFMNKSNFLDTVTAGGEIVALPFEEPLNFDVGFMYSTRRFLPKIAKDLITFIEGTAKLGGIQ